MSQSAKEKEYYYYYYSVIPLSSNRGGARMLRELARVEGTVIFLAYVNCVNQNCQNQFLLVHYEFGVHIVLCAFTCRTLVCFDFYQTNCKRWPMRRFKENIVDLHKE